MNPKIFRGGLSGKTIHIPDYDTSSINSVNPAQFILNGEPVTGFKLDNSRGFPDSRSYRRKFGLLIPATNTVMERELWTIIGNNPQALDGVGIHTANIETPKIKIQSEADLEHFKNVFTEGINKAIAESRLARPEYLIMGMSLEHILYGLPAIRSFMDSLSTELSWATWHEAADAALKKYKAKRIGLISPFNKKGNENAKKLFEDMGYEVVVTFGFSCPDLVDIAHIPDAAKEEAVLSYMATPENHLDAVVQLGTNMSMTHLAEKLEPKIGIPIVSINAATFWYALRENGISEPLLHSGRLLRDF